jgi:hypothetical protein
MNVINIHNAVDIKIEDDFMLPETNTLVRRASITDKNGNVTDINIFMDPDRLPDSDSD